jgi:hypothetical protein
VKERFWYQKSRPRGSYSRRNKVSIEMKPQVHFVEEQKSVSFLIAISIPIDRIIAEI